jgi:hypothetical protein
MVGPLFAAQRSCCNAKTSALVKGFKNEVRSDIGASAIILECGEICSCDGGGKRFARRDGAGCSATRVQCGAASSSGWQVSLMSMACACTMSKAEPGSHGYYYPTDRFDAILQVLQASLVIGDLALPFTRASWMVQSDVQDLLAGDHFTVVFGCDKKRWRFARRSFILALPNRL